MQLKTGLARRTWRSCATLQLHSTLHPVQAVPRIGCRWVCVVRGRTSRHPPECCSLSGICADQWVDHRWSAHADPGRGHHGTDARCLPVQPALLGTRRDRGQHRRDGRGSPAARFTNRGLIQRALSRARLMDPVSVTAGGAQPHCGAEMGDPRSGRGCVAGRPDASRGRSHRRMRRTQAHCWPPRRYPSRTWTRSHT